jgi:ketosteroid isomerase-like protein
MAELRAALEAANADFYASFEALSLDRMDAVWDTGNDVWCVHPGMDMIVGWPAVRRSWAAIFAATPYMQFIVTDVHAILAGDGGMVCCTENILSGGAEGGLGASHAIATNIFVWRDGGWRMIAHHASPVLRPTAG